MDNLNPPVVTTEPNVVDFGGFLRFLDMFTVTDPDPDAQVLTYQVRDNRIGGGNFLQGEQVLEANVWHEVSAFEARGVRYRGADFFNRESFSVRVWDGNFWSNTAFGGLTSGNTRPVLTAEPGRVAANQSVRLDRFLTYFDADGDPDLRYFIVDRKIGADGGQFKLSDQVLPQGRWFQVQKSELASLTYQGSSVGGDNERISIRAFDGFSWSEEIDFQMRTTSETEIIGEPQQVLVNDRVAASEFFSTQDADGDEVTHVLTVDRRVNADGGYWEYEGERMPSATWFVVPIQKFDELFYVGGATGPQTENVGFQVYDGFEFSGITDVAVDTVVPPMVEGRDVEVQANHYLNIATGGVANVGGTKPDGTPILDYVDADGDLITRLSFVDRNFNGNGGHFVFKGDRLPPATWFTVDAAELDQLEYRGGEFGPQSENVGVRVFANGVWSETDEFSIGTLENLHRPELNLVNAQGRPNSQFELESLFTWSDGDRDALDSFRLFDTGDDPEGNFFSVNGIRQPSRTWIQLGADQIPNVKYHLSSQANIEQLRMTISDGRFTSTLQTATFESVGVPTIEAVSNDISVDTIQRVPVTDIVSQTDLGPSLIQYQVYDENAFLRSGRIELDGEDLQQGVVHTLTADEFNRLVFKGAETDFGRQLDPMLVRGDNGITGWTEWHRVNVNTDPVGNRSLTSGTQWFDFDADPRVTITYSFVDGNNAHPAPFYYVCEPQEEPDAECDAPGEDGTLNQVQRETFRETLQYYAEIANLKFVELPYTQIGEATMVVGTADLSGGAAAWAYLPNGLVQNGSSAKPGDVWFDSVEGGFDPDTNFDAGLGTAFRFTAFHEVGHALGLKHPFDDSPVLSVFTDFDYNTVMSYTHDSVHNKYEPYDGIPQTASLYDITEIQRLYGANQSHRAGNDQYGNTFSGSYPHFIGNDDQNQTTLWDGGGFDTLNFTRHVADETIDLRQGTFTSINGVPQSLRISYDTVIENARGGSGDDNIRGNETRNLLFGNAGNDVLRGGGGNDVYRGGAGDDTYIWSLGDGRDLIREEDNGGMETIEIYDPSGTIDSLEDDFVFRRFGNNLRIDMTLNQGEGQGSLIVADFGTTGSTTELLTIHDALGSQIGERIDLTSVFAAADSTRQRFRVTDQVGANEGFIAVPVI